MSRLNPSLRKKVQPWLEENAKQTVYRSNSETIQQEKNKRNNVEASIFQLCFHTRNNKTRYRGKLKHELWAFARCAWINLRRIVLFQSKNAPEGVTGAHNGTLSPLMAPAALVKTMSQTCVHLKLYFAGLGFRPVMVTAGLEY